MSEAADQDQRMEEATEQTASTAITEDRQNATATQPKSTESSSERNEIEGNESRKGTSADADEEDAEADSEAETLIQSPEKKRGAVDTSSQPSKNQDTSDVGSVIVASTSDKENTTRKRKRSMINGKDETESRGSSRHSSPLSSPAAQVPSDTESPGSHRSHRRTPGGRRSKRDSNRTGSLHSENEVTIPKKRRRRPSEIVPPSSSHKRSKQNSIDATERRETRSATYPHASEDERSPSPGPPARREHRRGASTQLTTHEFERKKRGRPPLINTRRNRSADRTSVSSDGSEPTRRSRPGLPKFSSHDQDTMSPAKVGPRKWKDKNGRTYLARACANEDLEAARARLAERPEDLNMEDNAGNTPLQIASLEGFVDVVEFLVSKGAEVNVRNLDKDTPLIDAVENGHVDVVRILLANNANPRMGNAKGDEPYELAHPDDENYTEIRRLLTLAKDKDSKKNLLLNDQSDQNNRDGASSRAASAPSPRDSPPTGPRSPPAFGSRRRTGRSESTRNDLLWQANTQENLAKLAGKGDVQGVANILSILEKAETESLIAAAKAGHEEVLQLLIAMGRPDPDPDPVRSSKMGPGYNTPMLAAIGRGHPDVVKLLANQSGFNPMRRWRQKAYYELAQERRGDKWEQEFNILKQAHDRYATAKGRKTSSPRKTREVEKSEARGSRKSVSPVSIKRQSASPSLTHKSLPSKVNDALQKEKRKVSDPTLEKRKVSGRQETADSSIAVTSDADPSSVTQKIGHRTRRSQSDLPPPPNLESDSTYKRRRLLTGKEHRSRQHASTSSDAEAEDVVEVKQEEKPTPVLKRGRSSVTPDPASNDAEKNRASTKKRRTVLESSPEEARTMTKLPSPPATNSGESEESTKAGKPETRSQTNDNAKITTSTTSQSQDGKSDTEPQPVLKSETKLTAADVQGEEQGTETQAHVTQSQDDSTKAEATPEEDQARKEAEAANEAAIAAAAAEAEARRLEEERKENEARQAQEAEAKRRAEEEAQAKRKTEEDRQEQIRRDLEDRRRQQQMEEERRRVEALPIVLGRTAQMIDQSDPEVRSPTWLNKFLPLYTVKTKQLDPDCDLATTEDEWIANFQAAGLLVTKDLNLRNYTSFEKRPVSLHQRRCLWRVARLKLSYDFNPMWNTSVPKANEIEGRAETKFMGMDELFWVKLSDFTDQVSRFPHLRGIELRKQPISLKSYDEIFKGAQKLNGAPESSPRLPNGISTSNVYGNGQMDS